MEEDGAELPVGKWQPALGKVLGELLIEQGE